MGQFFGWSQSLPKPTGILIVSAHWESAPLAISTPTAGARLVYDFSGFDRRYFEMSYPTPDASALATRVVALMSDTEPVHQHPSRGLDHGAWVPLKVMYPYADVPVLQLSMPSHDPDRLIKIGERLRPLREEGVLIIGSGFMTHGLPFLGRDSWWHNTVPSWSRDFDAWAAEAMAAGAIDRWRTSGTRPGCRTRTRRSSTTRRCSSPSAPPPIPGSRRPWSSTTSRSASPSAPSRSPEARAP